MVNYNKLLNKYYKAEGKNQTAHFKINNAERTSNKYHNKIRRKAKEKHRYLLLHELIREAPFKLNKDQIKQIEYWLMLFNDDFKNFHRKASEESILLALIMIQQKQSNPDITLEKYSICDKYKLTTAKFLTIQNRLIFKIMQTTPLVYSQAKFVNHEILVKEGKKKDGIRDVQ